MTKSTLDIRKQIVNGLINYIFWNTFIIPLASNTRNSFYGETKKDKGDAALFSAALYPVWEILPQHNSDLKDVQKLASLLKHTWLEEIVSMQPPKHVVLNERLYQPNVITLHFNAQIVHTIFDAETIIKLYRLLIIHSFKILLLITN